MIRLTLFLIFLLVTTIVRGGGKHFEIMAPMSQQSDFHGKPNSVIENRYRLTPNEKPKLISIKKRKFDEKGNDVRLEEFDGSGNRVLVEVYKYDSDGTWISFVEKPEGGALTTLRIFLDFKRRRVAKVNISTKDTEFLMYSDNGFEIGSVSKSVTGNLIEKTTIKRNDSDKEVYMVFEEPVGIKTDEFIIEWSDRGFQTKEIFHMLDQGGDKLITQFEYKKIDDSGNWLVKVEHRALTGADGKLTQIPDETVEREITYHE